MQNIVKTGDIRVGVLGAFRGESFPRTAASSGMKLVAICDNFEVRLEHVSENLGVKGYLDFDEFIEHDMDAIVVAAPFHLHAGFAMKALDRGKHVLSETSCNVTLAEGVELYRKAEDTGLCYMLAENYCYIPENQLIRKMAEEGLFGDVYFGEGEYLHELSALARYPGGRTSWRSYWQLGQRGNFYPTHSLGPVMQWFGNERIKSVNCFGTRGHTAPEFRQDDTTITMVTLESGKLIKLRLDCLSQRPHNLTYYTLQGTLGCYEAPRGLGDQHKIWLKGMDEDTDRAKWRPLSDYYSYLPDRYRNATDEQKSAGHWGGDFFIVRDFMDAVESGARPPVDIYDACEWTAVALLSELSVMNGGRTMEVPDFRKVCSKDGQITRL